MDNQPKTNYYAYGFAGFMIFVLMTILSSLSSDQDGITITDVNLNNVSSEVGPEIGNLAPDFTFSNLKGEDVTLSKHKGKVILLNIWATWCGPCLAEMPSIEDLYLRFKSDKFEVLAVSIDQQGIEVVDPYVKKMGLSFPVLIDTNDKISMLYQTTSIPQTFVIDKNGIIAAKIYGARDWASEKSLEAIEYLIDN